MSCERVQQKELSTHKLKRLDKIMVTAQKQCGRATGMQILPPKPLKKLLDPNQHNIVASPEYDTAIQTLSRDKKLGQHSHLFVGPEGGFTAKERDLFKQGNAHSISLGESILRAETAAIVLATLIKYY